MIFKQRELKSYAEPVSPNELKESKIYFSLNYADQEMLIPVLEPVVFIGRNLESGDNGQVYFQDIDSYLFGIRYDSKVTNGNHGEFFSGSEDEISHIFDYEKALDQLMLCSVRRNEKLLKQS